MDSISGFWHAVACLSGKVDWSAALRKGNHRLEAMQADELSDAGVSAFHQKKLRSGSALHGLDGVLLIEDPHFPPALRHLPYAPGVLFYAGNVDLLSETSIAIVGARRCTQRAKTMTASMASELAKAGMIIVSGLAYGVDSTAHKACLSRTIAVLGEGIDRAQNGRKGQMIQSIIDAGGLIVSEFPPYRSATRYTFPQRNRVIAGLAIGTVVVEASMRSGSRITARHALEYGREVMAIPGHPFDHHSSGCNALIKDGALLVQNANDVLINLNIPTVEANQPTPEGKIAKQVFKSVGHGVTLDELLEKTGLPMPTILVAIESLELTGWVQRLPGDRICSRNCP